MRLRNIKNAEEIIKQSSNYSDDIKFEKDKPLYIEIGMGKGNFIINNAKKYKDINFIGIEKYASVLVKAVGKIEEKIPNLKIMCFDANDIDKLFDKQVDLVYLNFSDPWHKKRHWKRRLSSSVFLEKYDKIFKDKKHIIMKTDNRKLAEFSIKSFTDYGYKINEISLDLYDDNKEDNIPTEYEEKFTAKGMPIYYIDVEK